MSRTRTRHPSWSWHGHLPEYVKRLWHSRQKYWWWRSEKRATKRRERYEGRA
jgi:hypothetical protein